MQQIPLPHRPGQSELGATAASFTKSNVRVTLRSFGAILEGSEGAGTFWYLVSSLDIALVVFMLVANEP